LNHSSSDFAPQTPHFCTDRDAPVRTRRGVCGIAQDRCEECSWATLVATGTICSGSQRSREGNYVSSSTHAGARFARRRTRAAITTAAALLAAAAFSAGSAQAAVVPSAVDPNTTLPNSFTDGTLELGLCTNTGCAGARPNQGQPVAVPGNFFADAEAFWYLNTVELSHGSAEFAVEAAFEDLAKNAGGAFTRQRFRFDGLTGTVRLTTPYGSKIYEDLDGGLRTVNDTVDLGLVGGCIVPSGSFCDYAGANYGTELTKFLVPVGFDAATAAAGDVITATGPVVGAPSGYNGVKLEQQVGVDLAGAPIWQLIEEQKDFTLEMQIASAPAALTVFAGVNTTSVDFPARRSDESSGNKTVTVKNDGAAPLNISSIALSGPNAASFTASSCPATLAVGASCVVTVRFIANSGVGGHDATLTINNDSVNAPAMQVAVSGTISGLPTGPAPAPTPGATIIQTIPGAGPATLPAQGILGSQASSPLRVSNLSLSRRISVTRLGLQGLRMSMRVPQGTNVLRIAVYKARNGQKTGSALFRTTRTPRAGLYRVTLRNASLLRKLKTGSYVVEVRAGSSAASLGTVRRIAFTVTR
jgi:hypothetical protein